MKETVRERYARAATTLDDGSDGTPPSLGLGDVVEIARLRSGETILDLGSGPGRDLFAAADAVGPTGRAIGVDMTPEMLERSRRAAESRDNVSIVEGDLEGLPLPCGAVDVVISNCVINLTDDKRRALTEAFRVLRPCGRFAVLDTAFETEPGEQARAEADWCGCVAGSLVAGTYEEILKDIGFVDVALRWEDTGCGEGDLRANAVAVTATKPADAHPGTDLRPAVPADGPEIQRLLAAENLPTDLRPEDALVALDGDAVIGVVGLERAGGAAYLRSLVVEPDRRRAGLGFRLTAGALEVARWSGATDVYLFTKYAASYFERYGFVETDPQTARAALSGITLDEGCASATPMHLSFEDADLPFLGRPSHKALPTFDDGCSCC